MSDQYSQPVRAVVLAAGQGKRIKSVVPKILHDVLGKPILKRVLDALEYVKPEHIHMVIGHASEQVRAFLSANEATTPYSTHVQEPQLGTGHAVMQVVPALDKFKGILLVTVGDTPLLGKDVLKNLLANHIESQSCITILSARVEDPKNYGRIVRSKDGNVLRIVEDKDANAEEKLIDEVNAAIYCLNWPDVEPGLAKLTNNNKQEEYYLTDLVGWAVGHGKKVSAFIANDWRELAGINTRLELAEAARHLRDKTIDRLALESGVTIVDPESTWIAPEVSIGQETVILPGCYITGSVVIGRGCTIGPHTVISGPCFVGDESHIVQSHVVNSRIGSQCRVGPFAHLREQAVIDDNCRVGNFVEVKKSEVGRGTNISHLSYIGDAFLGDEVNIGAGTITANYDRISGRKSETRLADGASTGSNSVLVAPVSVGAGAMVAAGTVITRDVPAGALAVGRARQDNKEGWVERCKRTARDMTPLPEPS